MLEQALDERFHARWHSAETSDSVEVHGGLWSACI